MAAAQPRSPRPSAGPSAAAAAALSVVLAVVVAVQPGMAPGAHAAVGGDMPVAVGALPVHSAGGGVAAPGHAGADTWRPDAALFESGIVDVDANFFLGDPGVRRYLVFGGGGGGPGPFGVAALSESAAASLSSRHGYSVMEDFGLDFHGAPGTGDGDGPVLRDASRIGEITGSLAARERYGASGNGTVVAIVDTGVDFSNPDMRHSLARDPETNHPVMLDPDGQGIVITNATFFAYIDDDRIVRNYSKPVPAGMASSVYVGGDGGVFLDVSQGGNGTTVQVYNSFFPAFGSSPVFNGTLSEDMRIGSSNRDYIESASGLYRLGVMYQGALQGPSAGIQVVPVLVVDSFEAGVYDTVVPDLSTSWADYTKSDLERGQKPDYDFDFTDEEPITLGSGKEFLVYDSDGDGRDDYTAGTVGARVLDVYGAIRNDTGRDDSGGDDDDDDGDDGGRDGGGGSSSSPPAPVTHDLLQVLNGTLLPAMDPGGRFFGVMTDFDGHGTASAASIASSGQETYDIYNDSRGHTLPGVAPGAAIIPVKALWFGDTAYGWLWAAGFDHVYDRDGDGGDGNGDGRDGRDDNGGGVPDRAGGPGSWEFSGRTRADIISNSWGISAFPAVGAAPGMDVLSLLFGMLAVPQSLHPDYPGVVMVASAGNSGHGYGTTSLPAASPLGISVGATTNNVFVGYGPFEGQPRFGNTTDHHGHVADFSSRGPTVVGDPKPDLLSVGAYGFTPSGVMRAAGGGDGAQGPFALYGGTSMAAPLVAGAAASVVQSLRELSADHDPFTVRNILMSTAADLGSDPFTQGAGLADIESALGYVHGERGAFVVHNDASYLNIRDVLGPAVAGAANHTGAAMLGERFGIPPHPFPMTGWFAGHLHPGERATATFTVHNPSDAPLTVRVAPEAVSLISQTAFEGTTEVHVRDPVLDGNYTYAPNYVRLSDVRAHDDLSDYFEGGDPVPDRSSLMVLGVNFDFDRFMNGSAAEYADDIRISSLYLYDWADNNNDTRIASDELSMVSRAGSWGTVQEMRVSDPAGAFEGTPVVGVYPVPTRYSYWTGDTGLNSTSMGYQITASHYAREGWSVLWPESGTLEVPAGGTAQTRATLVVPEGTPTGAYQGFLAFEGQGPGGRTVNAPVSFAVVHPVGAAGSTVTVRGETGGGGATAASASAGASGDMMYGNGYTKGAFDMAGRYMSGDWRQYYFDIQDPSIESVGIEVSWEANDTNIGVFAVDPSGRIVQTNVPAGVFGQFLGWASLDWLGSTPFSQGGGFYPVKNKNDTSTLLSVPVNRTGTYALLAHSTLFGGNSTTEPLTVTARFAGAAQQDVSVTAGNIGGGGAAAAGDGAAPGAADVVAGNGADGGGHPGGDGGDGGGAGAGAGGASGADGVPPDAGGAGVPEAAAGLADHGASLATPAPDQPLVGAWIALGMAAGAGIGVAFMLVANGRRRGGRQSPPPPPPRPQTLPSPASRAPVRCPP